MTLVILSMSCDLSPNKSDKRYDIASDKKRGSNKIRSEIADSVITLTENMPRGRNSDSSLKQQVAVSNVVNVKAYGAKGDGKSDDTRSINAALASGKSVYIPAGEYIIAGGPLVIRGKKNLRIYGDGNKTWLHPPDQLRPTDKKTFYTTFSIDKCNHITIENLRIESKGENWGNADAGHKEASGSGRTDWIIEKGGHAVAILRSTNVTITKVSGRLCGSTGVFYASSSDMITFTDCFANAASLGYAGFAVDNFADTRPTFLPGRRYYFNNCKTWAEPQLYPGRKFSAKGAIVAEGDNGRVLNIYVNEGTFKDCGTGGDAKNSGAAVSAENSNLTCKDISASNNYIGIRIRNRSDVEQGVSALVENSEFTNNGVCGVYIASAYKGAGTINIIRSNFTQKSSSVWRFLKDPIFGETAGIITEGYMSQQKININNSAFSGGEKYLLSTDRINLKAIKCRFSKSTNGSFEIFGGGTIGFEECDIDLLSQGKIASHNYAKKYSSPISLSFNKNNIQKFSESKDYWDVSTNSTIKNSISVQRNEDAERLSRNAVGNAPFVSGLVSSYALQGENTSIIITMDTKPKFAKTPVSILNSDNQTFKILHIILNWDNNPNVIKVFLAKDVRRSFPQKSKVILQ